MGSGSRRTMPASDARMARQASGRAGTCGGRAKRIIAARPTIRPDAAAEVPRQPMASASAPLAVRDSRIPASSGDMTVPMALPRSAAGTAPTANGTAICGRHDANPSARLTAAKVRNPGASAVSSSIASAYPIWLAISARPIDPAPTPREWAIIAASGWA